MPRRLLEGVAVGGGTVTGPVRVITEPRDAVSVQPGEILVVPTSHPEYALGVMQAAGLVCEEGGIICHLCIVAAELGIPCVTDVRNATTVLTTARRITLDGDRGVIYES
jgi:pyruvate,water dikinase